MRTMNIPQTTHELVELELKSLILFHVLEVAYCSKLSTVVNDCEISITAFGVADNQIFW